MCAQRSLKQIREMICLFRYPPISILRYVFLLVSEVALWTRNPPVLHSARESLFMKIQIVSVPRIPPFSAPHLKARLRVSCKNSHRLFVL